MKTRTAFILITLFVITFCLEASAQGTAFTYQGRLNDGANQTQGNFDFRFSIFDSATNGSQIGNALTNSSTSVSNGLFTVTLDFGPGVFIGSDRWLELGVRSNGVAVDFQTLAPRQQITATPYAIRASSATTADTANTANSINASNVLGTLSLAQLPAVVVTNGATNLTLGGAFSGDGIGLISLNASNLTGSIPSASLTSVPAESLTGTVADGRLSANVALLNGTNAFSGTNRFSNVVVATNANSQFSGNGSGLTSLTPANIAPGTAAINISGFANSFSTPLAGDVTGTQSNTVVANVGGQTAAAVASGAIAANAATSANTTNTLVKRDASGNFSAGIITANGSAITNLSATNISSGTIADQRLSTNVALLNGTNVFSGTNRFSNIVIATNLNNQFSGLFSGNGAALTSLAAANLTGILPDARLSTNVALLNSNQTFSGTLQFNSSVTGASFSGNGAGLTNIDLGQNSVGSIQTLSFTLASQLVAADVSYSLTAVDVNNDGKPDLVDARFSGAPSSFIVFTNNGNGGFVPSATNQLTNGAQPRRTIALDVNGDGKVDLLFANQNTTVGVFTNDGSGGFSFASSFGVPNGIGTMAVADVRGDTNLDVVFADSSSGSIQFFTNNGSGVFSFSSPAIAAFNPNDIAVADVNGDTKVDLIAAGPNGPWVFTNNGSGGFGYSTNLTTFAASRITMADVNGDGKPDIATTVSLASGQLAIYTNNGSGGFAFASAPSAGGPANAIVAADVNGDGRPDLLVPANTTNSVSVLINLGGGNFALRTSLPTGLSPQSIACADFNSDGKIDVAAAGASFSTIYVYQNNGITFNGSFVGNGSSLSNLNASQLTSGTIADARLSTNVVLLNATNVFTGTNRFAGVVIATNGNNQFAGSFTGNGGGLTNLYPTNLVGALPLNTTLKFTGDRTNGFTNAVIVLQNTNTSANAAPALRVQNDGGATPNGALSVSANVVSNAANSIIAQFGNASSFVVVITNDGTIFSKNLALTSDRNAKETFSTVNGTLILEKLVALPMTEWDYKDTPGIRHLGPMAQDFHAAFGLNGPDNTHISVVDEGGVALAAIQGLNQKLVEELKRRDAENAELRSRLEKLEAVLNKKPGAK